MEAISNMEKENMPENLAGDNVKDALMFGIYEHEGVVWGVRKKRGGYAPITNFTINIVKKNYSKTHYEIHLEINNIHGCEAVVILISERMVSRKLFRNALIQAGNFMFLGSKKTFTRFAQWLYYKCEREIAEERPNIN